MILSAAFVAALVATCRKNEPNTEMAMETALAGVEESEAQPAPGEGEARDNSASGAVVRWHPGLSLLEPGGPWRPVVVLYNHGLLYKEPFTDDLGSEAWGDMRRTLEMEVDRSDVTIIGRVDNPAEVEITAARSVYTLVLAADEDPIGPRWGYYTWLKIRAQGKEGWATLRGVQPDFVDPYGLRSGSDPYPYLHPDYPPVALVRFDKRFSPLREGPAATFPRTKGIFRAREYADEGEVDEVVARFGDWLCISHGWLPADTPGLSFHYLTYAWRPYGGEEEAYFYLPVEGDVDRIIYWFDLHDLNRVSSLPDKNQVMTVSAGGREYDLAIDSLEVFNNPIINRRYFEAVLPQPLKRDDIESVTFTVGAEPHRVKATFDPREAWAEHGEGQ
jgi:hypothetical protein